MQGPGTSQNLGQRGWWWGADGKGFAGSDTELAEADVTPEHFGVPFLPEPQEEALVATASWFLPGSFPSTLCSSRAGICFSRRIPHSGHIVGLGDCPQSELRSTRPPLRNGWLRNEQPWE